MVIQEQIVTVEAFWEIIQEAAESGKRLELINGRVYEMPPSSQINTVIAGRVIAFLFPFIEENDLGYVTAPDGGFQLAPDMVRLPDVAFISKARHANLSGNIFPLAPDLAVEVVSPTESAREVLNKIAAYLRAGTRMVWAIYPRDNVIDVHRPMPDGGILTHTLTVEDTLDGGEALPGFKLAVKAVFPD